MLEIEMEFHKGILFVRLNGILDQNTSKRLDRDLSSIIYHNGIKYVLLNLRRLRYLDYVGVEVLSKNYDLIRENQGKFMVCGLDEILDTKNILKYFYQLPDEISAYDVVKI